MLLKSKLNKQSRKKYQGFFYRKKLREERRIRQEMGEVFFLWADDYFSNETRINTRTSRKKLYSDFLDDNLTQRNHITAYSFKKRIKLYCTYKGYHFNPTKRGDNDKTNGVEYFTIANELYA